MVRMIVNPIAGNGRSVEVAARVEAELARRGLSFERVQTEYTGHATELAVQAADAGHEGVISVGGDGTLSEVVSGIAGRDVLLLIVPCGTGNDFTKTLKFPKDPIEALLLQLDSEEVQMDVGEINGRRFINTSGAGFDVEVLIQAERYKASHQGLTAYLLGVLAAIRHFKPLEIKMTTDGATVEKKVVLIEIANGQYIGGGMRVAPTADPTDGMFDVYYVDAVPRYMIPLLLPLFIFGWYRHLPIAHVMHVKEMAMESMGMTVNIDGHLVLMDRAAYKLLPGALKMRCTLPSGFAATN